MRLKDDKELHPLIKEAQQKGYTLQEISKQYPQYHWTAYRRFLKDNWPQTSVRKNEKIVQRIEKHMQSRDDLVGFKNKETILAA